MLLDHCSNLPGFDADPILDLAAGHGDLGKELEMYPEEHSSEIIEDLQKILEEQENAGI